MFSGGVVLVGGAHTRPVSGRVRAAVRAAGGRWGESRGDPRQINDKGKFYGKSDVGMMKGDQLLW